MKEEEEKKNKVERKKSIYDENIVKIPSAKQVFLSKSDIAKLMSINYF